MPEGKYPLELYAEGLQVVATQTQPISRGTIDGNWDGVESVKIRVNNKQGEYQEKAYQVEASDDKTTARLTPAHPLESTDKLFWWTSIDEEKTVTAWAPYEYGLDEPIEFPSEWTKEDFAKYDIIGVNQTIGFKDRNEPQVFQHLMTKFVFNLRKTPYLENAKNVKVLLNGHLWKYGLMTIDYRGMLVMKFEVGQISEYITPYHLPEDEYEDVDFGGGKPEKPFASYAALVPPLRGIVSPLLIIEVDGVKYNLRQNSFTDEQFVEYRSGQIYVFNVTVKENGVDVTVGESIHWGTGSTGSGEIVI
ncbi:MAG: fimbrillin family protein [Bacteroidales bacterium]|nr:fimbrillin family protein [Bacteroidales bacterium]